SLDAKYAILLIKKKLFIYTQDLGINLKITKLNKKRRHYS
ncbi:hypothetical protein LCGC14_2373370, partial [marine sediment metagenome]